MKKITSIIMAALILCTAVIITTGCKSKYNSEINVYNWGEYISRGEEGSLDVIADFEEKYNIKVNYTNFDTNEAMYNILKTSNSPYDVIIPSDYMISKLIEEDMLLEIDFNNVPNYKYIMEDYKDQPFDPENKYSVPYSWGVTALVYNKDMVKEKVDSWNILWDEKYKGEILMFDNSRDAMAIATQVAGLNAEEVTIESIDKGAEKLKEQNPLVKMYVMDKIFTQMEGNQAAVAPYYAGDIITMMSNNEALNYALPKEGSNLFIDSMCIPKSSQNKEGAEKFINFMLEGEVGKANVEYIGYSTPNKATFDLLGEDIRNNELFYPSEEYLDKCYTFSNLPDKVYDHMQEEFLKAKVAKAVS